MSLKYKGGIIFGNEVTITDEKKKGFPYYMRALQLLIIIIGCYSTVSICLEALNVSINQDTIYLVMLIASIVAFLFTVFPSYDLVKAILSILFYGLFFYSRLDKIINGFFIIENLVIDRIDTYYEIQSFHYIANMNHIQSDVSLVIAMVLVPLAILYAAGVVRSRYISLCNIFLLIPVAASFAIGLIPSEKYLIAYLMITLYLSRSFINFRAFPNREQRTILHRINMKAALTLSLMGVLLFLFMKNVVPEQKYNKVTEIKEVKSDIQTYLLNFSLEDMNKRIETLSIFPKVQASGGLNEGELGKVDQIVYDNKEHLRIWAPLSSLTEGLYLKGYVGSDYTGDSWNGHSKGDKLQYEDLFKEIPINKFAPVNQVSTMLSYLAKSRKSKSSKTVSDTKIQNKKLQLYQGKININYIGASKKFLYTPYYTDFNRSKGEQYLEDLYAEPLSKRDSYQYDYYYGISFEKDLSSLTNSTLNKVSGLKDFSKYEKIYRDYVYQVYTELPEEGLEQLKQDFAADNPQIKELSIKEKIKYVKDYLDANTQYSLSPGKTPKGKDFVEYFLYENKKGYCTHYASAAVLMLRAMGIPARYVEGYVVGASDIVKGNKIDQINKQQTEASIKDRNAHAWVEVYIDGCGFVPVEFTPGSTLPNTISNVDAMSSVGNELIKNQASTITVTPTPKIQKQSKDDKKPTLAAAKKTLDKSNPSRHTTNPIKLDGKIVPTILLFAFITVVLVLALLIYIRIRNKKEAKLTGNNSKLALLLFDEIEKMFSVCEAFYGRSLEDHIDEARMFDPYMEQEAFISCIETVRKARFGKECIDEKELDKVEGFHSYLYQTAFHKLSIIKRIYLKIILSV